LTPSAPLTPTTSLVGDKVDEPPKSPTAPEDADDEGILMSFRRGEASFRELVSSVLLVVRTHEVRSVRLAQAVVRLISGVGLQTGRWRLSLDVAKIALDEMASTVTDFLADERTTIVAIEAAFEHFAAASLDRSPVPDLRSLLRLDAVSKFTADLPDGAGRRRRSAAQGNVVSPTEAEDATTFFVLLRAYEHILAEVAAARGVRVASDAQSLHTTISSVLQDKEASGTYLDKKEALARVAHHTLKHSLRTPLQQD
jgi:hypothetical protein